MRDEVIAGEDDPLVRAFAVALCRHLPQKDFDGEVEAIFDFVQNGIRYIRDPFNYELLHWARNVLEQRAGDCDDKVILLCAMLNSIGNETHIVAYAGRRGDYSHVICCVDMADGRRIYLDPTEPHPMGWAPPNPKKLMFAKNEAPQ
jgi:transglutaminase-like putative cysteine protease